MTRRLALALPLAAVLLTACGSSGSGGPVTDGTNTTGSEVVTPKTLQYNGHPLYCVGHDGFHGRTLDCNWMRYHQETGL